MCEWKLEERGFLLKNTARVGTLVPWKETARERTRVHLEKTARERTQAPLKAEATRRRDGEFRKSGREVEEEGGEVQKKEMVEAAQRAHHKSIYDENEERQKGKGKQKEVKDAPMRGKPWRNVGGSFSF